MPEDSDLGRFVLDSDDMVWLTLCPTCKHLNASPTGEATCAAFPHGVPARFLDGTESHRTPAEGDGGIVYAARKQEVQ